MTVFAYGEDDIDNPFAAYSQDDVSRLPFGATELDRDGKVVSHQDTEPDDGSGRRGSIVGRDFFGELARWPVVADGFRAGVAEGNLNLVFDCAVPRLTYKLRVHLKISPILGTYWVFVKKLKRQ
ncbi:Chain B, Strong Hydrogen Bonds In Photoactive Yellow Protein [Magnetospirillum sp. UT-4]|nr:Chain B, Strong Hydrogen Bonds In Photoactive Yellow Protein [Magnetospirillum sp. UT-4]